MYTCAVRPEIAALSAYVPGMSIAEIQEKYGLSKVVKMASNENPLGVSPLVKEALGLHAGTAFRYPQGGNPRLVAALARTHGVSPDQVVVGNGSDEIIDMLIRMLLVPGKHSVVCFEALLQRGIIIRPLKSYSLPDHLRVSVGSDEENTAFLEAMKQWMQEVRG